MRSESIPTWLVYTIACIAVVAVLALAAVAQGKDTVPSKKAARAYIVKTFPPVAVERITLPPPRNGKAWRLKRLKVEKARDCFRGSRQVECEFTAFFTGGGYRIKCGEGEIWVKRRDGALIGRVGDYVCVA